MSRVSKLLALFACMMLGACSTTDDLRSGEGAELAGHPLFTASDAFVVDRDPTFMHPRVVATLYFIDPTQVQSEWWRRACLPPSITEYEANLHHWEEHARLTCDGARLIPLPAGSALNIETLERTWDPENGTMYHISARLLDTTLSQHEIYLRPAYFVVPHGDEPWRLNPAYFAAQPSANP